MKIEGSHFFRQLQSYQNQNEEKPQERLQKRRDRLEISAGARRMQIEAESQADREKKILQLKEQIANGTYNVDARQVAKKFYEYWNGPTRR